MAEPSLGKGLESLIPSRPSEKEEKINDASAALEEIPEVSLDAAAETSGALARTYEDHFTPRRGESIFWVELEKVEPNPFQPRRVFDDDALKQLAGSIREHGVLQPVLVTKREVETPQGIEVRYQLIAGERRLRAARLAGLSQIPAIIRRGIPDDRIRLELALIENVQREDLNPIERGRAFKQLINEFHLVQRELAERIGKSREVIANTIRLLTMPIDIQNAMIEGKITEGHARAILMAGDNLEQQRQIYNAVLMDRLTVREAESKARHVGGKELLPRKRASAVSTAQDPEWKAWQHQLAERLGTRVILQKIGERGKIVVEFQSGDELRSLVGKLIQEI